MRSNALRGSSVGEAALASCAWRTFSIWNGPSNHRERQGGAGDLSTAFAAVEGNISIHLYYITHSCDGHGRRRCDWSTHTCLEVILIT
jgi:hypothetical protein